MLLKLTVFLFVFAILYLIREGFEFYKAFTTGVKNITILRLWGIGIAISFIITMLFTGFGF